jgi:hypothetical protein
MFTHADQMNDELGARERALRKLPLSYSLALRLRDAGVAAELVCEYVDVEDAGLEGFYRIAEAKLVAAQEQNSSPNGKFS